MEIWKDIKGYEGLYKISNYGNVFGIKANRQIGKNHITKDGYNMTVLSKEGKSKTHRLHRIVAEHFVENPEKKETVNHIDGDKQNNAASNLEWNTREENMKHAYKLGLKKPMRGHDSPRSKLTKEQVEEIRTTYKRYKKGFGSVAIAKKFGVESSTILRIVKGENYY